jgi:hypothetical protein
MAAFGATPDFTGGGISDSGSRFPGSTGEVFAGVFFFFTSELILDGEVLAGVGFFLGLVCADAGETIANASKPASKGVIKLPVRDAIERRVECMFKPGLRTRISQTPRRKFSWVSLASERSFHS